MKLRYKFNMLEGNSGFNIEETNTKDHEIYYKTTNLDKNVITYKVFSPLSINSTNSIWKIDPMTINNKSLNDCNEFKKYNKEHENMNIYIKPSYNSNEHIIVCSNENDLLVKNVLKTLSAMKGKLIADTTLVYLQKIECSMTPLVKRNIIDASKRLKMYGKKRPIIARFDEFGNRLSDEINLGMNQGITLKIIDPEDNEDYYMELKGIEIESEVTSYSLQIDDLNLFF